ncbi:MAG: type II secretion system protein [Candidatus Gottesmanbacteria bacterium]|nr:type II secretion system protein [Candidatus Gottesmanbacteria bacterium]
MKRGFTLIELLIVIAVIGILVSIATFAYTTAQKKTRDSRRKSDLKAIQSAMEQYNADFGGSYPSNCSPGTSYLPNGLPTDPKKSTTYVEDNDCTSSIYCVCAELEGETNSVAGCDVSDTLTTGYVGRYCVKNVQ